MFPPRSYPETRMSPKRRHTSGHNLLEAIIAGFIFAVVTVALMGVWDMQFKAMLKSKETAVASFLAEQIMEECIAAGYEEVGNLYPAAGEPIEIRSRTKKGESITVYLVEVKINQRYNNVSKAWEAEIHPDSTQRNVVVVVSYNDSTSPNPRTIQYHTVLNQHG
jgi:Tfp pilus assembly protein PilV